MGDIKGDRNGTKELKIFRKEDVQTMIKRDLVTTSGIMTENESIGGLAKTHMAKANATGIEEECAKIGAHEIIIQVRKKMNRRKRI